MQTGEDSVENPKHIQSASAEIGRVSGIDNPNIPLLNSGTGGAGADVRLSEPDEQAAKRKKIIKWSIIGGLGAIVLTLAIVLPIVLIKPAPKPDPHGPLPDGVSNPYNEVPNSLTSDPSGTVWSGKLQIQGINITSSEFLERLEQSIPKSFLQELHEAEKDTKQSRGVDWRNKNFFGPNNNIIKNLNYLIDMPDYRILRAVITDSDSPRFSIPYKMVPQPTGGETMRLEMLGVSLAGKNTTFGFKMVDVTNASNWLLDTTGQTLLFSDKYIQMDFKLPSQNVYGLGDRVHYFKLQPGAYSLWASGQTPAYDDGRGRGGLSGVHPFIMVETMKNRRYIGLFFRNANAMTPILRWNDDGTSTLSFITIGGQIEVYVIGQGTAHQVVQQYQQMIGLAQIPPYWALGWQEATPEPSANNVNDQNSVVQSFNNYLSNKFPLEAVYLQADSWDQTQDFKLDTNKINDVGALKTTLAAKNVKLVAYIDSAVSVKDRSKNSVYNAGKALGNVFIKSSINSGNPDGFLVNSKNGKNVVYLDWLNNQCANFWSQQVAQYARDVPFDGLWTTMNEPYGDQAGELSTSRLFAENKEEEPFIDTPRQLNVQDDNNQTYDQSWFYSFWPLNDKSTYKLPFVAGFPDKGNYDQQSISLNATHDGNVQEYNMHNLYAHGMMNATAVGAMMNNDNRPFILTRGSFASTSHHYVSQAHSNLGRSWDHLYFGLQSVLRSQMFGMPHTGADICGQNSGDKALDEELCLRWYQLATFFPLARHAQDPQAPRSEPFKFQKYKTQVLKTMHDRMQYLRLMYTCMFEVSDSGGTCLDPVHFRYPVSANKYKATLPDVTTQFIFAGSLLVSPIMNSTTQSTFSAYFPSGNWVNMADWTEVIKGNDDYQTLKVRDTVNVHLAPGALIPFQNNQDMSIMTSTDTLSKPITLVANRDANGAAGGSLFLDKGISNFELLDLYEYYDINLQANSIQFDAARSNYGYQPHQLDEIVIVNANDLSGVTNACYYRPDGLVAVGLQTFFDKATNSLHLKTLQTTKFSDIHVVYFSDASTVNMCQSTSAHTFDYNIVGGQIPPLNTQSVQVNLTHMGKTLDDLTLNLGFFDTGIINVQWTWRNGTGKRTVYKVHDNLVNTTKRDIPYVQDTLDKYVDIQDLPFQLIFKTRLTQKYEPVLTLKGFLFAEYLNWINLVAHAQPADTEEDFRGIFGLGERASTDFFVKSGVYSMWAKDIDNPTENGKLPGKEVYGVHPFYMFKHAANSWIGVYHNNAQAQDWWINNDFKSGNVSISSIATGGLGDLYFFVSSQSPDFVIAKYFNLVGAPVLTPQWALGWNQCRWCYKSVQEVRESAQGYIDNGIPLDTQWVDIDYMQDYKDFTVNEKNALGQNGAFFNLSGLVNELHSKNMKFIPIVDAGVSARPNQGYQAYDTGVAQNVFIKNPDGQLSVGKVWPNEAVYPDFMAPNTDAWWGGQLDGFHKNVAFDGLWQDMNEASNFCNGICMKDTETVTQSVAYKLPYTPTGESLQTKAINLDAVHANGYTELDAHSTFGALQVRASSLWFKQNKKRPMIISRSSFAGMGKYGSKWLGDNHAYLIDVQEGVLGIMKMNMFGITLIGADICGFGGPSTTPDLCARWHQIGAFQPFSRNHRACWGDPQEPWRFKNIIYDKSTGQSYMDIMKSAIFRKYHLMRYYYTQMSQVSYANQTYTTVYKPLFFEFPDDNGAYHDIANNVMIGSALKTAINAVNLSVSTTDFYFPKGTWCSLFEPVGECLYFSQSQMHTLPSRINESYVHLREGYIVPMQDATALGARTTVDLQKAPVDLHILGSFRVPGVMNWQAEGLYVNDDGVTTELQGNVNQYYIKATYTQTGGENLYIQVNQQMLATNYMNTTTNCSAVNAADYLGNIYVYNATAFKQHDIWVVSVAYDDDISNYQAVGTASFDPATNRIVWDASVDKVYLCLSKIFRIQFQNRS